MRVPNACQARATESRMAPFKHRQHSRACREAAMKRAQRIGAVARRLPAVRAFRACPCIAPDQPSTTSGRRALGAHHNPRYRRFYPPSPSSKDAADGQ